jgi:ubiquinone/menaquinone biosynthesis C-methylase UbiE
VRTCRDRASISTSSKGFEPGQSVLGIGSGWGGLSMSLVEWAGAGHVRGITRSEEQLTVSRRRAADRGLSDRITFALEDYRATQGTFDRIVSVGMFEHVNVAAYDAYFNACRRLLKKDGIMLLHTLGRSGRPYPTNPLDRSLYLPRRTPPCVNRVGAGHRSRRAGDLGHRGAAPSLSLYSEGVARALHGALGGLKSGVSVPGRSGVSGPTTPGETIACR